MFHSVARLAGKTFVLRYGFRRKQSEFQLQNRFAYPFTHGASFRPLSLRLMESNSSPRKKEGFHGEECDPSNMCTDEQSQFVACLRVPGNDAPHLSLLIQNKAKGALIVSITGPRFVRLDKNKVELLENQDTKVKVYSIKNKKGGSNGRSIILTSTTGRCSLELKDLAAAHDTVNHDTTTVSRPTFLNIGRFILPTLSLTELHYGHFQSFASEVGILW